MSNGKIIFAGGGTDNTSLMMWPEPGNDTDPVVVSKFPYGHSVYALAVSPNGSRIAAGTKQGYFRVFGLSDFQATENAPVDFDFFHSHAVDGLCFCSDDILASGGADGHIKTWSVTDKKQIQDIAAHSGRVLALCQLNSETLASVGSDGRLCVWDTDTLKAKFESNSFQLPSIRVLTSLVYNVRTEMLMHPSGDGYLYLYDATKNYKSHRILVHDGSFTAVATNRNFVVTAGLEDRKIKLWPSSYIDTSIAEAVSSNGVVSVGFSGPQAIVTALKDGTAQIWKIEDKQLIRGTRYEDRCIRTVTGLPVKIVAEISARSNMQWRNEQLAVAKQLIGRPEGNRDLITIVNDLCERGFSAEAVLLLADAAVTGKEPKHLWRLQCLLQLVDGLKDTSVEIPVLYETGKLLQDLNEPARALEYFERIQKTYESYKDIKERISALENSPILKFVKTIVRADLLGQDSYSAPSQNELISAELEKYSILRKKFQQPIVNEIVRETNIQTDIDKEIFSRHIIKVLTENGTDKRKTILLKTQLYQNQQIRNIEWVYAPSVEYRGIAFAVELCPRTQGTEFFSYVIFNPSELNISKELSAESHNQRVLQTWQEFNVADNLRMWKEDVDTLIANVIYELANKDKSGF